MRTLKPIVTGLAGIGLSLSVGAIASANDDMEALFAANCATCHGMDRGGYIAPALNSATHGESDPASLAYIIANGVEGTLMPSWQGRLSEQQMLDLATYITKTPKRDVKWTMEDVKNSIVVNVADETTLPSKPVYGIDDMNDLMAVTSRGTYGRDTSRVVFFNGKTNEMVGSVPTDYAPHIVDYHPTDERWAYVKTDGGRVYKVDLYSMKVVRSVKVGFAGPSLAVSWDGKYLAAGSFVPNTAVILKADTLEPVKFLDLKGADPDGKMVEADSGSITATPFGPYFAISLEMAGQVWIADLSKPDIPITKIEKVGRHLHDSFLTDAGGRYMAIAAYDDRKLAVIDFKDMKVAKDIPAGCVTHTGSGAVLDIDGRSVGISTNFGAPCKEQGTVVTAFDAKTFEVIKQIPVVGGSESPAAHPASPYIVVDIINGAEAGKIQAIDKKTLEVAKTIEVGGHSHFPEFTADGKYLYVSAGYAGNKLVIYDGMTLEKVKEVEMEVPAGIFGHVRPKIVTVGLPQS
ncbi:MAG: c-type cytochrome [Hyphomicrobiales bacterium]|nr:c-type cytochrome [Hyphomicrobiales bacterium]